MRRVAGAWRGHVVEELVESRHRRVLDERVDRDLAVVDRVAARPGSASGGQPQVPCTVASNAIRFDSRTLDRLGRVADLRPAWPRGASRANASVWPGGRAAALEDAPAQRRDTATRAAIALHRLPHLLRRRDRATSTVRSAPWRRERARGGRAATSHGDDAGAERARDLHHEAADAAAADDERDVARARARRGAPPGRRSTPRRRRPTASRASSAGRRVVERHERRRGHDAGGSRSRRATSLPGIFWSGRRCRGRRGRTRSRRTAAPPARAPARRPAPSARARRRRRTVPDDLVAEHERAADAAGPPTPSAKPRSVWQSPQASTSTIACPGSGDFSVSVRRTSGAPAVCNAYPRPSIATRPPFRKPDDEGR